MTKWVKQPRPIEKVFERSTGVIKELNQNDVLCGRGSKSTNNPGNIQYREIVNQTKPKYFAETENWKKKFIAAQVVERIRSMNPPGRFLKESYKHGPFYDVGDKIAFRKTGQALREDAPALRQTIQLKNTNTDGGTATIEIQDEKPSTMKAVPDSKPNDTTCEKDAEGQQGRCLLIGGSSSRNCLKKRAVDDTLCHRGTLPPHFGTQYNNTIPTFKRICLSEMASQIMPQYRQIAFDALFRLRDGAFSVPSLIGAASLVSDPSRDSTPRGETTLTRNCDPNEPLPMQLHPALDRNNIAVQQQHLATATDDLTCIREETVAAQDETTVDSCSAHACCKFDHSFIAVQKQEKIPTAQKKGGCTNNLFSTVHEDNNMVNAQDEMASDAMGSTRMMTFQNSSNRQQNTKKQRFEAV